MNDNRMGWILVDFIDLIIRDGLYTEAILDIDG